MYENIFASHYNMRTNEYEIHLKQSTTKSGNWYQTRLMEIFWKTVSTNMQVCQSILQRIQRNT